MTNKKKRTAIILMRRENQDSEKLNNLAQF